MDDVYKEFVIPNGIIYPGRAVAPVSFSGDGRVALLWYRGNDPKVVGADVFYNNYEDTLHITNYSGFADSIDCSIPVPENSYTFVIRQKDTNGNYSVPVEVLGISYGDLYKGELANRSITKETVSGSVLEITWASAAAYTGFLYTELEYTTVNGNTEVLRILPEEGSTRIEDYAGTGVSYRYRSAYKPNASAIDTYYTDYEVRTIPK
jgi:hypothetical protein